MKHIILNLTYLSLTVVQIYVFQFTMVMTPTLELYDESCSSAGLSTSTLTSPASSSTCNTESPVFFSDEEIKQLDFSTIMTPIIKDTLKETIWKRLEETGKPVPEVEPKRTCTEQVER